MNKLKVMSVFGTRPEAIKMAPLVKALQACEQIESIVCLTGQHREMLDSVMEIFRLTGDYDLHISWKSARRFPPSQPRRFLAWTKF